MRLMITLAMFLMAISVPTHADTIQIGDLTVRQPWARELPPVSRTGAAYLSIHNTGREPDRLVSSASPVAARVEIHTHEHAGGMMRMRQVDGVDLPAGQRVDFAPGGLHLMLFDLQQPLLAGEEFAITLEFQRAGTLTVQVSVLKDAPPASHTGHGTPRH